MIRGYCWFIERGCSRSYELVLAQAAATNSNIIRNDFGPQYDFPQIASFDLLISAYHIAKDLGMTTHVGNVLSSDSIQIISKKILSLVRGSEGCLQMEAALYYLAAQHQVDALAIMTISDSLVNQMKTLQLKLVKHFH